MIEPAMTGRQVAEYLNVAPKVIYRLVQTGDLPGFKVAGTWRFKRDDLDAWIEEQKQRSARDARRPVTAHDDPPTKLATSQVQQTLSKRGEDA